MKQKFSMLWTLFWTFAKMGVMTFGGGMAMLPILQREVVDNKHWATEEELVDYFAIGQCTSGRSTRGSQEASWRRWGWCSRPWSSSPSWRD